MTPGAALAAYKLRLRRRRLLLRALRKSRELRRVAFRLGAAPTDAVLVLSTIRNEAARLPHWLDHHRALGVGHFLVIDNGSDDGTAEMLAAQPDVSLWTTAGSYKASRFGVDWLNALAFRHARGRWCLTVDADELWLHPHHETRDLRALTHELDRRGQRAMGALMLDLYPRGRLGDAPEGPAGATPEAIPWFDAGNYVRLRQPKRRPLKRLQPRPKHPRPRRPR